MLRGLTAILLASALVAGCGHSIGDSCSVNIDCDPLGQRFCDTSAPGGYCTIDGCDVGTCPSEAVCIRFFTPVANEPCIAGLMYPENGCRADERCVCDLSVGDVCQTPTNAVNGENGHCAPETTERRWCQKSCGSDGDCRPGYECRSTGTLGAEPVPSLDMGTVPAKFCAPAG